jgi:hypothetical protein
MSCSIWCFFVCNNCVPMEICSVSLTKMFSCVQCGCRYCCPICSKSVCDMSSVWEQIDREIASTQMPESHNNKQVCISIALSIYLLFMQACITHPSVFAPFIWCGHFWCEWEESVVWSSVRNCNSISCFKENVTRLHANLTLAWYLPGMDIVQWLWCYKWSYVPYSGTQVHKLQLLQYSCHQGCTELN